MAIQARKKRKAKPKKNQNRKKSDSTKPKKSESDKNEDQISPPAGTQPTSTVDDNDTDSAPDIDEEEILGSDDDEQESPKDYCKVSYYMSKIFKGPVSKKNRKIQKYSPKKEADFFTLSNQRKKKIV